MDLLSFSIALFTIMMLQLDTSIIRVVYILVSYSVISSVLLDACMSEKWKCTEHVQSSHDNISTRKTILELGESAVW